MAHVNIPLLTRLKRLFVVKVVLSLGGERAIIQSLKGFVSGILNTIVPRLGATFMNDQPDKILADLDFSHGYEGDVGNGLFALGINMSLMEDIIQQIYAEDTVAIMTWMAAMSEVSDYNLKVFSLIFLSCTYSIISSLEDYDESPEEVIERINKLDWLYGNDLNCDAFWGTLLQEIFGPGQEARLETDLLALTEVFWGTSSRVSKTLLVVQLVNIFKVLFDIVLSHERSYGQDIVVSDFVTLTMFSLREAHANALLQKLSMEDDDGQP